MSEGFTRREFIRTTGTCMAAAGLRIPLIANGDHAVARRMPQIQFGSLTVSRLILGSNQFFGYSHMSGKRDREMLEYFTDERIMAFLDEAADFGITSASMLPSPERARPEPSCR